LTSKNYTLTFVSGTLTVLGPGAFLVGTEVFIVGGQTSSDQILVLPAGSSQTGSTGVQVKAVLNQVPTTMTFNQPLTGLEIFGYSGNDNIGLFPTLTLPAVVSAGDGNDNVGAGNAPITLSLGNGNDGVLLGDGNNNVTLGSGNDTVGLGNGNNVVLTGNGNTTIQAGNGDNLIAAGLGHHTVKAGNGSNILIDGTVSLTQSGDSLGQVLSDWISKGATPSNVASIRARLKVTDNTNNANTLLAGSGLDWFWENYSKDTTNPKPGDLLN
jgi:Ca2+-binding RTX toxin-like protein